MGAKLVREVAQKTQDKTGDGTTTATLLAQAIITEGLKNITSGANPIEIKRGIDAAVTTVVEYIGSMSTPVKDREKILQVATVSANNDEEIGKLISDAMEKVGYGGLISDTPIPWVARSSATYSSMSRASSSVIRPEPSAASRVCLAYSGLRLWNGPSSRVGIRMLSAIAARIFGPKFK